MLVDSVSAIDADVIVVGAGLAGLVAAGELVGGATLSSSSHRRTPPTWMVKHRR